MYKLIRLIIYRRYGKTKVRGLAREDWIEKMKKSNQLIMGIGHRIKSLANPDQRAARYIIVDAI